MTSVSLTSRYQRNRVGILYAKDGRQRQAILPRYPDTKVLRVVEHLWTAYDRIDLLAAQYYGNETSWWMISESNPTILDWTQIPVGTLIRIPRAA